MLRQTLLNTPLDLINYKVLYSCRCKGELFLHLCEEHTELFLLILFGCSFPGHVHASIIAQLRNQQEHSEDLQNVLSLFIFLFTGSLPYVFQLLYFPRPSALSSQIRQLTSSLFISLNPNYGQETQSAGTMVGSPHLFSISQRSLSFNV